MKIMKFSLHKRVFFKFFISYTLLNYQTAEVRVFYVRLVPCTLMKCVFWKCSHRETRVLEVSHKG